MKYKLVNNNNIRLELSLAIWKRIIETLCVVRGIIKNRITSISEIELTWKYLNKDQLALFENYASDIKKAITNYAVVNTSIYMIQCEIDICRNLNGIASAINTVKTLKKRIKLYQAIINSHDSNIPTVVNLKQAIYDMNVKLYKARHSSVTEDLFLFDYNQDLETQRLRFLTDSDIAEFEKDIEVFEIQILDLNTEISNASQQKLKLEIPATIGAYFIH